MSTLFSPYSALRLRDLVTASHEPPGAPPGEGWPVDARRCVAALDASPGYLAAVTDLGDVDAVAVADPSATLEEWFRGRGAEVAVPRRPGTTLAIGDAIRLEATWATPMDPFQMVFRGADASRTVPAFRGLASARLAADGTVALAFAEPGVHLVVRPMALPDDPGLDDALAGALHEARLACPVVDVRATHGTDSPELAACFADLVGRTLDWISPGTILDCVGQQCAVRIDERGATAAAESFATFTKGLPPEVVLDAPFRFWIVGTSAAGPTILFQGTFE